MGSSWPVRVLETWLDLLLLAGFMITLRNGFLHLIWLDFSLVGLFIMIYISSNFFHYLSAISGVLLVIIPSITVLRRYFNKVIIDKRLQTSTKYKKGDKSKVYKVILANEGNVRENDHSKPVEV